MLVGVAVGAGGVGVEVWGGRVAVGWRVAVDGVVGVAVGGAGVSVGRGAGMKGTKMRWPTSMRVELPKQLASCSWATLTPSRWLRLNRVSPGWTV